MEKESFKAPDDLIVTTSSRPKKGLSSPVFLEFFYTALHSLYISLDSKLLVPVVCFAELVSKELGQFLTISNGTSRCPFVLGLGLY